jgi:hypothetical protein
MTNAAMLSSKRSLNESEAVMESFHDCHVHGLRWRRDAFSFSVDLQYILEWIEPTASFAGYQFSVCEARLVFQSVSDLKVQMDWSSSPLDAQIEGLRVAESRATPNGGTERLFEIEFADPEGSISLWSSGYELVLLGEPVLTTVTSTAPHDDR